MNDSLQIAINNESLSILDLIMHASLLVQLVMLILVIASLISWTVIFTKSATLKKITQRGG